MVVDGEVVVLGVVIGGDGGGRSHSSPSYPRCIVRFFGETIEHLWSGRGVREGGEVEPGGVVEVEIEGGQRVLTFP